MESAAQRTSGDRYPSSVPTTSYWTILFDTPMQLMVSFGQLYGLILYYGDEHMSEDLVHGVQVSRPERIYFYAYYVASNAFWLFIPAWLIYESVWETSVAFTKTKLVETSRESKRNGYTNADRCRFSMAPDVLGRRWIKGREKERGPAVASDRYLEGWAKSLGAR